MAWVEFVEITQEVDWEAWTAERQEHVRRLLEMFAINADLSGARKYGSGAEITARRCSAIQG